MSEADRKKWEGRYSPDALVMGAGPPATLLAWEDSLPRSGRALDVAAGEGQAAVWLAERGLEVDAVDISPRGLGKARGLAEARGLGARVRTWERDLDDGLPAALAPAYDLVTCLHFWPGVELGRALVARLAPGGLFVLAALSAAAWEGRSGGPSPRFLTTAADARAVAAHLTILGCDEAAGAAGRELWLVARRPE
ncbi:MAG: SAM-dependent methyltransferase [Deltaproteobacteria bacterium HGW-Deltaproteobacteria-14]|nr:MAG: SAM-dependent methyltransferase [Deltaproteobacteria bacterium HGW-Deltaproteobacteria-14]